MANTREIRRRIGAIQNTAKITNALQLVAASKMRRAQDRALASRPYAQRLRAVLAGLASASASESTHPLLDVREPNTIGIVHVTPSRGLCGGLNSNLNRSVGTFVAEAPVTVQAVAVGKKGRDFLSRSRVPVVAEFIGLGDFPTQFQTNQIASIVIEDYIAGRVDRVYLSFAELVTTAVQRPVVLQVLPITRPTEEDVTEADAAALRQGYIFEPSAEELFERLLPRYVEVLIYEAVLESAASEQSARMVAMKNASDNALEIERELTLTYNKVRQQQITSELLDIVGGAEAVR
jgi:F-type H+-transporting ATPase subunit gamma